jgi:uncharacterized membrane protein
VNEKFLAQVRLWTILVALSVSAVVFFAISFAFALGIFLTAVWAAAGLLVLERLLRAAIVPRGSSRDGWAIFLWSAAKIAIYAVAVWVLFSRPLPVLSHAVGFTLMMVIMVGLGARARSSRREDNAPHES